MPCGPPSWLAHQKYECVVELTQIPKERNKASNLGIGMLEKSGKRFLQPERDRLLI